MTTLARLAPAPGSARARGGHLPRRVLSERGLVALVTGGAVAVLGLWWHDTTILAGLGEWLTAAGRITGLLGGYTVAVVLLLMSRAPWIEHGLGSDRLARWHAMGGRYLLGLLVAHALLITWGYAITAQTGFLAEATILLVAVPNVLMATIGLGVLVVVGIISARSVRRRVSYETWYLIHLLTYLAVGLSFLHVLTVGADFRTWWAKAAWIALYGAVGSALLWHRWLVPLRDAQRHRLRVASVTTEAPRVVSITVAGKDLDRLGAEPGQFFRWRFLTRTGWWQSHPFSMSAIPTNHELRITVKDLGDHSRDLQGLRPGTRVIAEGPYGAFTPARRRGHGVLLLAGGIGITPLRTMLEHHARATGPDTAPATDAGPVTLLYRANRADEIILAHELDALAQAEHIEVHYLTGATGSDTDALVDQRLRHLVPRLEDRDAFVCGPPQFMDAARESLLRCGVPAHRIHTEQFTF